MPKNVKLFLDGKFIPADSKLIKQYDPWRLTGRGVFETMRAYEGDVFLLDEHLNRLRNGLRILGLRCPYTRRRMWAWVAGSLSKNALEEARVRLTVWADVAGMHVSILSKPFVPLSRQKYHKGFSVCVADVRRRARSVHSAIKSIRYEAMMEAYRQAQAAGYDEAVILNTRGEVAEGSRTNIFAVSASGQTLFTPPVHSGCLNGITRQYVLGLARRRIPVKIQTLRVKHLETAAEVFLTSSLMEIVPVTSLGRKKIGAGVPGELTRSLMTDYRKNTLTA